MSVVGGRNRRKSYKILTECVVLAFNEGNCPLPGMAARFTVLLPRFSIGTNGAKEHSEQDFGSLPPRFKQVGESSKINCGRHEAFR